MNQDRYKEKLILAPMVRVGTLPMRLLALKYGADLVYTEEIIDHKLIKCERVENATTGTVDFLDDKGNVVLRTCDEEKDRVVVQIGTSDAERALKTARLVENDVSAIDINMGCPKGFSIKGGMGAALLTQPEKVRNILNHLSCNLKIPVTCKIRILDTLDETISLCRIIEKAGVSALAVHGRTKEQRHQNLNRNDYIKEISKNLNIPIIANGGSNEILKHCDIKRFQNETGASSVMIARRAEENCSIFRRDGLLEVDQVIKDYLKFCIKYDNNIHNTKYCIQHMLSSRQASKIGKALNASKTIEQVCALWNMNSKNDVELEIFDESEIYR